MLQLLPRWYHWSATLFALLLFGFYYAYSTQVLLAAPLAQSTTAPSTTAPSNPDVFVQVDGGWSHTCARTAAGGVWCWGENLRGGLGDGTTDSHHTPTAVRGLEQGVRAISTGLNFSCALHEAGYVQCWGSNEVGQLGNSSTRDYHVPTPQAGLPRGVVALDVGGKHACALTEAKRVYCWGDNNNGQVGAVSPTTYKIPTAVADLPASVAAIATGESHTCTLVESGEVFCWGANSNGQLGDGTTVSRSTPAVVQGLRDTPTAIAAGMSHTCALLASGQIQCWGDNSKGKLGDGTENASPLPIDVMGLLGRAHQLAVGNNHACALVSIAEAAAESVAVQCWGNNLSGQLGDGIVARSDLQIVTVVTLEPEIVAVTAGGRHSCALSAAGTLQCWGHNDLGQLGVGSFQASTTPQIVAAHRRNVTLIRNIAAGYDQTCAITMQGNTYCWGRNYSGQLGTGDQLDHNTPAVVESIGDAAAIGIGAAHSCVLTSKQNVQCWGYNEHGQVGNNKFSVSSRPAYITDVEEPVTAIAVGGFHTCALITGSVYCWGENVVGQVGDGTERNRAAPSAVKELSHEIVAITAGWAHSCALDILGNVYCWGNNQSGQLGDGTTTTRATPVAVRGMSSKIVTIAAGVDHTCALAESGTLYCWGLNVAGQLGDGSYTDRSIPVPVIGMEAGVSTISLGANHSCVLLQAGSVYCWGGNKVGQLGIEISLDMPEPVEVPALQAGVTAIAAGGNHTCALIGLLKMQCWGDNAGGQIGIGHFTYRGIPNTMRGLLPNITAIATGAAHSCVVNVEGTAQCWGENLGGQLGNANAKGGHLPVDVIGLEARATAISAAYWHTCALLETGGVQCWGDNRSGQLGSGSLMGQDNARAVLGLSGPALAVVTGGFHACAIIDTGEVQCWGDNQVGQLGVGDNSLAYSTAPVSVNGLTESITAIVLGADHTCGLTQSGGVQCWGSNETGQLGYGDSVDNGYSAVPLPVNGLASGVIALAAGAYHTCALTETTGVYCWGNNDGGQLGESTSMSRSTPMAVRRSNNMVAISAGLSHTCALLKNDYVQCWGGNEAGQLQIGDGQEIGRALPVTIENLFGGIATISAGAYHNCILTNNDLVQCWGGHIYGQIGEPPAWEPREINFP